MSVEQKCNPFNLKDIVAMTFRTAYKCCTIFCIIQIKSSSLREVVKSQVNTCLIFITSFTYMYLYPNCPFHALHS